MAQGKGGKETSEWERLLPMDQRVILAASTSDGITILSATPKTIHRFPNTCNTTALHEDCALTYAGQNLHLTISFCQALFQVHILEIPDQDSPTGFYPLLTHPESAGPVNKQQDVIQVKVQLAKGQDCLSK